MPSARSASSNASCKSLGAPARIATSACSAPLLVLFWIIMAVFADVLPHPRSAGAIRARPPQADAFAGARRRHLLARHRRQGPRYSLAPDLRLAARALLVDARHRRRLCRRHADGRGGRLSRRLVGRDPLLHRQRASSPSRRWCSTSSSCRSFEPGIADWARCSPSSASARRGAKGLIIVLAIMLRHRAAGGAHRARPRARPQDARLYRRRRSARRERPSTS